MTCGGGAGGGVSDDCCSLLCSERPNTCRPQYGQNRPVTASVRLQKGQRIAC